MDLDHVGNHLTACQTEIDAIRSLALTVTDIGCKVSCSVSACCVNTFTHLFHQDIQMTTTRMTVAKGTLDDDLRLTQILFLPTGSDPERIQLRS